MSDPGSLRSLERNSDQRLRLALAHENPPKDQSGNPDGQRYHSSDGATPGDERRLPRRVWQLKPVPGAPTVRVGPGVYSDSRLRHAGQ